MSPVLKEKNVKDDLLNAAGKLFAEKGFNGTSVRDIIGEAGATLSSVNYHFGGKENLYLETIRFVITEKVRINEIFAEFSKDHADSAENVTAQLCRLIRNLALPILDPLQPNWYGDFIARSLLDSTPETVDVFMKHGNDTVQRFEDQLKTLVPVIHRNSVDLFTTFLFGQIQFLALSKELVLRTKGLDDFTPEFLESVIRQISRNLIVPLGLPEPNFEQDFTVVSA